MNYEKEILVNCTPEQAFNALTKELILWWGEVDNQIGKAGDGFTIFFGVEGWKFKVIEFEPNAKLTWKCVDGLVKFNKEWIGTTLYWTIEEEGDKTKVKLLHDGLVPQFECYDICSTTWDMFITESLKNYLETGKGNPHTE
ncbi:MAG: SRPBCC domain-containing protein [Bacteroidia bacterium]|nr:SRPBCC domain-containing protein [Bacteroidia bacterium]NNC85168.1 SRPBCC domain-containing protein [Bacteroidia bacterium]NNM16064.1 SRPBCC domain-containing protein [Bacteroidia bacterium]